MERFESMSLKLRNFSTNCITNCSIRSRIAAYQVFCNCYPKYELPATAKCTRNPLNDALINASTGITGYVCPVISLKLARRPIFSYCIFRNSQW